MTSNSRWWQTDDELPPTWLDHLAAAYPEIEHDAQEWWRLTSPETMVGSRHHTVPRFYLERFAKNGQLWVRDRVTGDGRMSPTTKTGVIKDFYTFINIDGEKDGRLERILGVIEDGAKDLFDRMLSPFHSPRPLAPQESMHLGFFLAFQLQRTPQHRRMVELLGDFMAKTQHPHLHGIDQVRVVPEPNLHLEQMTKMVPRLSELFFDRPALLVTLDQPLFITCDEPVVLVTDGSSHIKHAASCFKTQKQRRKAARRPSRNRLRNADIVHVYPTRPTAGTAVEVALPLSPRTLLVLGPRGMAGPLTVSLNGAEAMTYANDVNARLIDQAYGWVAAHPDHPTFRSLEFPPPGPLVQACDGGTKFSQDLDKAPNPRRPELLGRSWQ
ncbi:DUF4238 domain-containing protein [Actinoplanes sp. Pm04-4]|uniref:DUF4238 domain-containing protein n=1 Tax=Paractinoplanes pyxinae TaxID=2997416 RepID=A0ABT4B701_9ACTN|nr:DUF4238 domain-containing protein [Actinoplanes pyxinae]MCY1141640.1 DUF4238 domain-containing protein [Actinoplanes pyxinae]